MMSSKYSLPTTDWLTGVKDGHFELRNGIVILNLNIVN
jgi:hypothetical protein